jgi:hypothetical protein
VGFADHKSALTATQRGEPEGSFSAAGQATKAVGEESEN